MKTTMKRAVHIDFHTMPKIDDFGANYEPVDLAEMLADAHVTYVNIFARCNIRASQSGHRRYRLPERWHQP